MPHECFADEIAIDFPSVGRVVERMRDRFLGESAAGDVLRTDVSLTPLEAWKGLVVPIDVPVPTTCRGCGGRGETWTEPCRTCRGSGYSVVQHAVRVSVPPGVIDGACLRFRLSSESSSIRVEVRVAIRSAV